MPKMGSSTNDEGEFDPFAMNAFPASYSTNNSRNDTNKLHLSLSDLFERGSRQEDDDDLFSTSKHTTSTASSKVRRSIVSEKEEAKSIFGQAFGEEEETESFLDATEVEMDDRGGPLGRQQQQQQQREFSQNTDGASLADDIDSSVEFETNPATLLASKSLGSTATEHTREESLSTKATDASPRPPQHGVPASAISAFDPFQFAAASFGSERKQRQQQQLSTQDDCFKSPKIRHGSIMSMAAKSGGGADSKNRRGLVRSQSDSSVATASTSDIKAIFGDDLESTSLLTTKTAKQQHKKQRQLLQQLVESPQPLSPTQTRNSARHRMLPNELRGSMVSKSDNTNNNNSNNNALRFSGHKSSHKQKQKQQDGGMDPDSMRANLKKAIQSRQMQLSESRNNSPRRRSESPPPMPVTGEGGTLKLQHPPLPPQRRRLGSSASAASGDEDTASIEAMNQRHSSRARQRQQRGGDGGNGSSSNNSSEQQPADSNNNPRLKDIEAMFQRHASRAKQRNSGGGGGDADAASDDGSRSSNLSRRTSRRQLMRKQPSERARSKSRDSTRSNSTRTRSSRTRAKSAIELGSSAHEREQQHQQQQEEQQQQEQEQKPQSQASSSSSERHQSPSRRRRPQRSQSMSAAATTTTSSSATDMARGRLVSQSKDGKLVLDSAMAQRLAAELLARKTREKMAQATELLERKTQMAAMATAESAANAGDGGNNISSSKKPKKQQQGGTGGGGANHLPEVPRTPKGGKSFGASADNNSKSPSTPAAATAKTADNNKSPSTPAAASVSTAATAKSSFLKDYLGAIDSGDSAKEQDHLQIIAPVVSRRMSSKFGLNVTQEDLLSQMSLAKVAKSAAQFNQAQSLVESTSDKQFVEQIIRKLVEANKWLQSIQGSNHSRKAAVSASFSSGENNNSSGQPDPIIDVGGSSADGSSDGNEPANNNNNKAGRKKKVKRSNSKRGDLNSSISGGIGVVDGDTPMEETRTKGKKHGSNNNNKLSDSSRSLGVDLNDSSHQGGGTSEMERPPKSQTPKKRRPKADGATTTTTERPSPTKSSSGRNLVKSSDHRSGSAHRKDGFELDKSDRQGSFRKESTKREGSFRKSKSSKAPLSPGSKSSHHKSSKTSTSSPGRTKPKVSLSAPESPNLTRTYSASPTPASPRSGSRSKNKVAAISSSLASPVSGTTASPISSSNHKSMRDRMN